MAGARNNNQSCISKLIQIWLQWGCCFQGFSQKVEIFSMCRIKYVLRFLKGLSHIQFESLLLKMKMSLAMF